MILSQILESLEEKDILELFEADLAIWQTAKGKSLRETYTLFADEIDAHLAELRTETIAALPEIILSTSDSQYAKRGAILQLRPGQGGLDAKDWTTMLTKMYIKFFENNSLQHEILEYEQDETAGINHAAIQVNAPFAYLVLKTEEGLHRLERKSPFNAKSKMQTSHAGVEVIPVIEAQDKIAIPDKDLEIKTARSSGPGGQNVNKTETSVIIRHIPSGITIRSSQTRSQLQNRTIAMNILKSELLKREEARQHAEIRNISENSSESTIRTYDFELNQIKDHRTHFKTSRLQPILNGELSPLLWRSLLLKTQ